MTDTIKTMPVSLAWTNNLFSPDYKFKHSSGAGLYSVSSIFPPTELQDFQTKITQKVGEEYAKALYIKPLGNDLSQVKAKAVEYFENVNGRTYQKPYVKDMHGKDIVAQIEGEKAVVEVLAKAYPMYKKLGFILKGIQLVDELPRSKEEVEKEMWGIQDNKDQQTSQGLD